MKLLILGGASGDIGRDLTRTLLHEKTLVHHLTVTARKLDVARNFVESVNDRRITAMQVDVTDNNQLKKAMEDHDFVINTVGPFSRYAVPIMKEAIRSQIHYIDICDDIEPTSQLLTLATNAKESGIFLIIGMGWFPGMSNLLVKSLARQMDTIDEIIIAWVAGRKTSEDHPSMGTAGIEHFFQSITGRIVTFRNGKKQEISASLKGEQIRFPKPLGLCTCYLMEHPEPIMFPLTIPGIRNASTYFSLHPAKRNTLVRVFARLIDLRFLSGPQVTSIFSFLGNTKGKQHLPILTGSSILLKGSRLGQKGQLRYSAINASTTVAEATSQPLSCAVLYCLSHKIEPGVYFPEHIFSLEDIKNLGLQRRLPFVLDAVEVCTWNDNNIIF